MPAKKPRRSSETCCVNTILVEFVAKLIPITPEMRLEPRYGRPPRPKTEANGESSVRPKRKKKSD